MYQTFWNYQQKKSGEIVIAKEELQKMLDQAYQSGYNQAFVEHYQHSVTASLLSSSEKTARKDEVLKDEKDEADTVVADKGTEVMPHDIEDSETAPCPMNIPDVSGADDLIPDFPV